MKLRLIYNLYLIPILFLLTGSALHYLNKPLDINALDASKKAYTYFSNNGQEIDRVKLENFIQITIDREEQLKNSEGAFLKVVTSFANVFIFLAFLALYQGWVLYKLGKLSKTPNKNEETNTNPQAD